MTSPASWPRSRCTPSPASTLSTQSKTYHLTIEHQPLCADCALDEGVIYVRDDLAVEVKRDRLLVRRGKARVEVLPSEIRHLVNLWRRLRRGWWNGKTVRGNACARPQGL